MTQSSFPYLTAQGIETAEAAILTEFAALWPEYSPWILWLKAIPEGHWDAAFAQWVANTINGISGAQPGAI